MSLIASQITSLTVVYSTVYSDADQRKHQSSVWLAFVWGIHRDRWIPRTKRQLRGKCFHLMTSSWSLANPPVTGGSPSQRGCNVEFDVFFYAGPNKLSLLVIWDALALMKHDCDVIETLFTLLAFCERNHLSPRDWGMSLTKRQLSGVLVWALLLHLKKLLNEQSTVP